MTFLTALLLAAQFDASSCLNTLDFEKSDLTSSAGDYTLRLVFKGNLKKAEDVSESGLPDVLAMNDVLGGEAEPAQSLRHFVIPLDEDDGLLIWERNLRGWDKGEAFHLRQQICQLFARIPLRIVGWSISNEDVPIGGSFDLLVPQNRKSN